MVALVTRLSRLERSAAYHRYLPVAVNGIKCDALVDSGNTWRCVISTEFMKALGLDKSDLLPIGSKGVSTARSGEKMEVLGEVPHQLKLSLGTNDVSLPFRPAVLRDLGMAINISGPFLKNHGLDQLHSKNAIRYKGLLLPLKCAPTNDILKVARNVCSLAVVHKTVTVPPLAGAVIPVRIPAIEQQSMKPEEGVLQPGERFYRDSNVCPTLSALVCPQADGVVYTCVLNTDIQPVTVKKGTEYGVFQLACEPQQQDRFPGRMAVVASLSPKPAARPTLRQKLAGAVKQAEDEKEAQAADKEEKTPITNKEKITWLVRAFKLTDCPCLQTVPERNRLLELLLKYWSCISVNGEFGKTNLMQHAIHTEPGPPIKTRYRPVNPSLETDLKKQLNKLQAHDVIEPSNSPWSFALVAAPKKNGKIRWCVDYRRLNAITKKDTFPLPHIEDNLARLADSKVFSCVDGSGAFHVLEIRPCDREKTAFSTPWGLYQYKRMPFGLTNGPASYSRLVQMVLQGIPPEMALPYLDDTIIHSPTVEQHFANLERVLQAHARAGLKLQPSKCQLFQSQVEYLGHLISKDGVRPLPDYVKAIQDWVMPTSKSEARVFLGKVGYYRRFIKNYSALARPWTDVTGKTTDEAEKATLDITPEMRRSFEALKKKLLEAPILTYPQFKSEEPFILDTDWSQEAGAVGAVLSQVQNGRERVIAYGAKKLSKAQQNYMPGKGELARYIILRSALALLLTLSPLRHPYRP